MSKSRFSRPWLWISAAVVVGSMTPAPAQLSHLVFIHDLEEENGVVEISSAEAGLGTHASRAGDVNGDGLDDILLTASERSEVILIYGQPGLPAKLDPYSGAARLSLMALDPFEPWHIEVGGGADVNGDGIDDLFVGEADVTTVVFGSRSLPDAFALDDVGSGVPGVRLDFRRGNPFEEFFRTSVHLGADVNGDGIGEIFVGDPDWSPGEPGKGRVHVIFGSRSLPAAIDLDDVGGSVPGLVVEGVRSDLAGTDGDGIGFCVQTAGDLDGDGLGDLGIAGNSCAGGSYIVYGRTEFPPRILVDEIPGAFGAFLEGVSGCMRPMGDLDGDGRGEAILQYGGETFAFPPPCLPCSFRFDIVILAGRDRVDLGPFRLSEEIVADPLNTVIHTPAPYTICPAVIPVDGGRDVDGDGRPDLLFARNAGYLPEEIDPRDDNTAGHGLAYFFSMPSDLPREIDLRDVSNPPGFQIAGKTDDYLGYGPFLLLFIPGTGMRYEPVPLIMGLLSDFDGDGRGDILLGAPATFRSISPNRAYVVPFRALEDPRLELREPSPREGLAVGGDLVQLSGRGFGPGTRFFFGGVEAEVISAPDQRLVAVRVPPWNGGPLEVDVAAVRGAQTSVLPGAFRYIDAPVIDVEDLATGRVAGGELSSGVLEGRVSALGIDVVRDVNGDGTDDIAVSLEDGSALVFGGPHLEGRTDFHSTPHGISFPFDEELRGIVEDHRVTRVLGSGDVDGDGVGDLAISTYSVAGQSWLHVVYGGPDLPTRTHPSLFPRRSRIALPYGHIFRIVRDLDGGGRDDVILGAFDESVQGCVGASRGVTFGVWIVHGEDLRGIRDADWNDVPKLLLRTRFQRIETFVSLEANGDGRADLAVQVQACGREGLLVLFGGDHLSGTGEILVDDAFLDGGNRGLVVMGRPFEQELESLGFALSRAGDVDGDGAEELLAGSPFIDGLVRGTELRQSGEAYLLSLRQDLAPPPDSQAAGEFAATFGLTPFAYLDPAQPRAGVFAMQGAGAGRWTGYAVSGAGDLDGDGVPDLAVGEGTLDEVDCRSCSAGLNYGAPRTFVLFGERSLLDARNAVLSLDGLPRGFIVRGAGYHLAGGSDVSGDGHPDLVLGRLGGNAYILFGGPGLGQIRFRRGDADLNGRIEISDAIRALGYLFLGAGTLRCLDAADIDDDGKVEITDPIRLLDHLFSGGPEPMPPFPDPGTDPTPDSLECSDV